MAYPTQPAGTVKPSWFGMLISSGSWTTTDVPDPSYAYAIVPFCPQPRAWDTLNLKRSKQFTVSRAVDVETGHYYDDIIRWVGPTGQVNTLATTTGLSDITNTTGWQTRQEQNMSTGSIVEDWYLWGCSFGVIEIEMWDDYEDASYSRIGGFSIDFICDRDYDAPGASSVRQHVERLPVSGVEPDNFASAYHAMWCVSESLNRCLYVDGHSNTWFLFNTQDIIYS